MKTSLPLYELYASALEELADLAPERAFGEAVSLLDSVARDGDFLSACVLPHLEEARGASDWYVAHHQEEGADSCSLQVFVWPPGSRTRIHDHSSWGAYRCLAGSLLEERYERLDDGSVAEHARLRELWQLLWTPQDGDSTVLAGDDGIHRVGNAGGRGRRLRSPYTSTVRAQGGR